MNSSRNPDSPDSSYTMGYSDEFLQLLDRRNVETNAAHLLAHLEPGMRVLDLGCGPGTISLGLAKAVDPGEVHGIDMEESQIEIARAAATAGGHRNASFRTGDATRLPYEDGSFDAAHCHAVLMHVPDTNAVLAEVKRVLKPGGLISAREMIGSSSFSEPAFEALADAWVTFSKLLEANGSHPEMGKELPRRFLEAGFSVIHGSASFEYFGTPEDVAFYHGFSVSWFFAPNVVQAAIKHGLATQEKFDNWRRLLDQWKDSPGAVSAIAWGEAVGRKP